MNPEEEMTATLTIAALIGIGVVVGVVALAGWALYAFLKSQGVL